MLQYLLNATAIWLLSLVLFDLFLRRESFHNYNRFYLLFTFLLGAVFPLIQWQGGSNLYPSQLEQPMERVITVKRTVIESTAVTTAVDWEQWLLIVYLIGALVAMILLMIEIIKLTSYFKSGNKSIEDGWHVIETARKHAPFSFLNTLFVTSKEQYNEDEWNMLLIHEKHHHRLFHLFDIILMQLGRIIFWFHPLAYIYNKRLLLVHEYQADKTSAVQPQQYGKFLVEQALLQSAPSISHSFNRSPVKKRILMLTRKSTTVAKAKMLVFVPLILVCLIFFSKNSFSQKFERNGNFITYKGNKFELSPQLPNDTATLIDPVTAQEIVKIIKHDRYPIKMNGENVYQNDEIETPPKYPSNDKSFGKYVLKNIEELLKQLPDGFYHLDLYNIVVGINGKIVYYEYSGISKRTRNPNAVVPMPGDIKKKIDNKIVSILNSVNGIHPGIHNGKKVPAYLGEDVFYKSIEIKDHKISHP